MEENRRREMEKIIMEEVMEAYNKAIQDVDFRLKLRQDIREIMRQVFENN